MKIKLTYTLLVGCGIVAGMMTACDDNFLDVDATNVISEETVIADSSLFEDYVINRYMGVVLQDKEGEGTNPGFGRGFEYGLWASITDESIYTSDDNTWLIQQGNLAPANLGIAGTLWARSYRSIRECNYALSVIDEVEMTDARKALLTAELKFIRAFRYQDLIRNYGKVVLMGDAVYNLDDDLTDDALFERASIADGIAYATAQLDEAAAGLPDSNDDSDWELGRATKGAALTLKARLLLYAASPLYNVGSWSDAADAAKAVMDLGLYSLHSDYQSLFLDQTSDEIIFERLYVVGARHVCLEISNGPNGYGGWGGNTPLANLVDDYEVVVDENTTETFDWSNATHAAAPYENRDPRFYASILYNGAEYREREVETFTPDGQDSQDGSSSWNTSLTGYYLMKFIDEDMPITSPWNVAGIQPWIYMRYAEVLLMYAEAQNEASGPDATVYDAVNTIRTRAGMPDLPTSLTQDEMREAIWHERRIELAFEEHRFYDVRRWEIAMDTENEPAYGVTITKDATTGELTYETKTALSGRTFESQHYWLPIPLTEIQASGGKLEQNDGY